MYRDDPSARSARPTVSSVAAHAGVSRQTVSNALNNPERLQPDTLRRVLTAIEETGYVRSAAARQMRTARSSVIAYRIDPIRDGIGGIVLDTFLHSLSARAEERGYRVMLYTAESDDAELRQFADLTQARAADAFVLVDTHRNDRRYRWLADHGTPFAVFGRPWPSDETSDEVPHAWIDVDGAAGTAEATDHLLGLGHRRIAFIGYRRDGGIGDDRRRGWEESMTGAGVPPRERRALDSAQHDGILEGADAARRLLHAGATAFVCASDSLAVGALSAVRAARAPAAVVGFDDSPTAAALGLSSVRQPLEEAAAWALGSVLVQLDRHSSAPSAPPADVLPAGAPPAVAPPTSQRLLVPRLVVRASSRPPG